MKTLVCALLAAALALAAETKLGQPLQLKQQTAIAEIDAKPAAYVGKTVQVKGTVKEVCQMMGCWMLIEDKATGKSVKIKVKDGEIVFPKDSIGKTAVAEGKFVKIEMTKEQAIEQAKHEAEANKKAFDASKMKGPQTIYQIAGTGAVIAE
jgi:hypothetical protein